MDGCCFIRTVCIWCCCCGVMDDSWEDDIVVAVLIIDMGFSCSGIPLEFGVLAVDRVLFLLASSAAKDERTEDMICWECVEAVSLSATSAAIAAAVFLDPFDELVGSFLSLLCILTASSV